MVRKVILNNDLEHELLYFTHNFEKILLLYKKISV